MRRGSGDERGFTLLELLIALAIVAALIAIAFGGMRVGLAAWRQGEDRAEAHQHMRGVALSLARVITGAYPYAAPRGEAPEPDILFGGDAHRLELVTRALPSAFPVPVAFAAVVIELVEGGERPGLVIRQRALPNKEPFTDAPIVFTDPTVKSLTFEYMNDQGAWGPRWEIGAEDKTLPRAVRLTVGTESRGRVETLPPMTISLRVLTP